MICRQVLIVLFAISAPVLLGCQPSSKSSINGQITYEGKPINHGTIAFWPADGRGAECSGPIEAGKYNVGNVSPGKKIVDSIGVKQIHFAKTHAEMAEKAKVASGEEPESADEVSPDAQGNNQTIEITLGAQELNFDLKTPGVRR